MTALGVISVQNKKNPEHQSASRTTVSRTLHRGGGAFPSYAPTDPTHLIKTSHLHHAHFVHLGDLPKKTSASERRNPTPSTIFLHKYIRCQENDQLSTQQNPPSSFCIPIHMTMCTQTMIGDRVAGNDMLRLLPMLSSLSVTFVTDNARRPAHSVSEEKRRRTPVKTRSKSRWESTAKVVTVLPTQGDVTVDTVRSADAASRVKKPSRRPSVDEEALTNVSELFGDNECDSDSWSPMSPQSVVPRANPRADCVFRSSIEAKKPCRRPSVDQEAIQQIAQLAREFDDDYEGGTDKRSSLEIKKPSRAPSLSRVQEEMHESAQSLHDILGIIQAEFGDEFDNK